MSVGRREGTARGGVGTSRGGGGPSDADTERGSATLHVVGVLLALVVVVALVLGVGQLSHARSRAADVAALAALAGAEVSAVGAWWDVGDRPCERARAVVEANGAVMESCEVLGLDVRVVVRGTSSLVGEVVPVTGRARAGPKSQDFLSFP